MEERPSEGAEPAGSEPEAGASDADASDADAPVIAASGNSDGPPVIGSGWVTPSPRASGPGTRLARSILAGLSVIVLIGLALAVARIDSPPGNGPTPRFIGTVIGTLLAWLGIGLVVRFGYLRLGRKPGRVISMWVPLVACLVGALTFSGSIGRLAPAPADVEARTAIASPYAFTTTPNETVETIRSQFEARASEFGGGVMDVREVALDGEAVGYLIVIDARISEADVDESVEGQLAGMNDAAGGGQATRTEVNGRPGVILDSSPAILAWVDAPYLLMVYAADTESAIEIGAASQP